MPATARAGVPPATGGVPLPAKREKGEAPSGAQGDVPYFFRIPSQITAPTTINAPTT